MLNYGFALPNNSADVAMIVIPRSHNSSNAHYIQGNHINYCSLWIELLNGLCRSAGVCVERGRRKVITRSIVSILFISFVHIYWITLALGYLGNLQEVLPEYTQHEGRSRADTDRRNRVRQQCEFDPCTKGADSPLGNPFHFGGACVCGQVIISFAMSAHDLNVFAYRGSTSNIYAACSNWRRFPLPSNLLDYYLFDLCSFVALLETKFEVLVSCNLKKLFLVRRLSTCRGTNILGTTIPILRPFRS